MYALNMFGDISKKGRERRGDSSETAAGRAGYVLQN